MTKYFTNTFSLINLFKKPSVKSEIVTQMLYGESFSVSKKLKKWSEIPPRLGRKSRKSEPGGTPKRRQEAKMEKKVVVSNSGVVLYAIFKENGSQDGGQNRLKINKKVH